MASCFKMAEKEAESEAGGWSVSASRVLIQFDNENPFCGIKTRKSMGRKI